MDWEEATLRRKDVVEKEKMMRDGRCNVCEAQQKGES